MKNKKYEIKDNNYNIRKIILSILQPLNLHSYTEEVIKIYNSKEDKNTTDHNKIYFLNIRRISNIDKIKIIIFYLLRRDGIPVIKKDLHLQDSRYLLNLKYNINNEYYNNLKERIIKEINNKDNSNNIKDNRNINKLIISLIGKDDLSYKYEKYNLQRFTTLNSLRNQAYIKRNKNNNNLGVSNIEFKKYKKYL